MWITRRKMLRVAFGLAGALGLLATGPRRAWQGPATVVPRPREGSWMEMHKSFLVHAKKGHIDLLFLGDSITQGWNENSVWQRFYGPRHAANFGIGGDRTQHVLWRIQNGELDGIEPKVTVLMIGTNNLHDDTPDEIAQGIKTIVAELRKRLPKTKVLLLGVFPRSQKPDRNSRANQDDQRKDRPARRRLARPVSRYRQVVPERRRHDLARRHAGLSSPEHQGLPHLGRGHGADALVDAR